MQHQIVPADKRLRRLTFLTAVLLGLLGFAALWMLSGHLGLIETLAKQDLRAAEEKVLRLAAITLWMGGLALVGMGGWLWRLGRRINLAGCYPPPGMKVIRDTRVRTETQARALANLAEAAALICVIAGTVGMWYLYRLAAAVSGQ
jgi:hypothetical protein